MSLLSSSFLWSSFPWSIRPSVDARRIWESFLNFKLSSGPVRKVKRNWRAKGARRALIRREPFWKGADWLSLGYVSPIHTAQKHLNHSPRWTHRSETKVTVRSRHWDPRNFRLRSFFRNFVTRNGFSKFWKRDWCNKNFGTWVKIQIELNRFKGEVTSLGLKKQWLEIRILMARSNLTRYR